MKTILKISITLFFLSYHNIYSQQLVQNISDVYKLEESKHQFINIPLKDLLEEIKPEIKTATVFNSETSFLFCFRFTTLEQQRKREGNISDRVSLFVYVKEFIPWNWAEKPKGSELNWTPNDAKKYADFIIVGIGVIPYME